MMTRRRAHSTFVAAAALAGMTWMAALEARTAQDAVLASVGVYTADQAARGQDLYEKSCAACHEPSRFTGKEFSSVWTGKPLTNLYEAVQTMPMDNPGSLKAQEYADIISHFLKTNGYPAGDKELAGTAEAMKAVMLDEKK
jgi:mono/diheme cytochrome c family protein